MYERVAWLLFRCLTIATSLVERESQPLDFEVQTLAPLPCAQLERNIRRLFQQVFQDLRDTV